MLKNRQVLRGERGDDVSKTFIVVLYHNKHQAADWSSVLMRLPE